MANSRFKDPPTLEETTVYENWKNEVKMWEKLTDVKVEKRALAIALSLSGAAREAAMQLDITVLNVDTGVATLLKELDKLFEKNKIDTAYSAYTNFDGFRKPSGMEMSKYVVEFEQKYNKAKKQGIDLPDNVLAFKLLDNASLSNQDKQLALTACSDLKFASMKSALNRIFANRSTFDEQVPEIKEEVFATSSEHNRGRPGFRRPYQGRARPFQYGQNRGRQNPMINGVVSKCRTCESILHYERNCPHKSTSTFLTSSDPEQKDTDAECANIVLMNAATNEVSDVFVVETLTAAVIDTACSKTVCGEQWLESYVNLLSSELRNDLVYSDSGTMFRFGDADPVRSKATVVLPAQFGSRLCHIRCEVIPKQVPLLLSKDSLKKADTKIDLTHDKVIMFSEDIPVFQTSSGHYAVDILPRLTSQPSEILTVVHEVFENGDIDLEKNFKKLHKQFSHASFDRLLRLLQSTCSDGTVTSRMREVLYKVCTECSCCILHKKPQSRPVVGFSLASCFNDVVSLDLHYLKPGLWYLHIMDLFSRLSAAAIIPSKNPDIIIHHFMLKWVAPYGVPKTGVYSDNGGEFNNSKFRTMAEALNMSVKCTAGYSPWSNGLLERNNAILTEMVEKVKNESQVSWDVALAWSVSAKNSLINVHGFSSNQLVFGVNPKLPGMLDAKLPAMNDIPSSEYMSRHLTALHAARQAFVTAESSEKIRRALRSQTRHLGRLPVVGDTVYYRRDNGWRGPAKIIGVDGAVVVLRHGGAIIRAHTTKVMHQNTENLDSSFDTEPRNPSGSRSGSTEDAVTPPGKDSDSEESNHGAVDEVDNVPEAATRSTQDSGETQFPPKQVDLKPGQRISFSFPGESEKKLGTVISRAGKRTGKHKNWYNIQFDGCEVEIEPVDFSSALDLQLLSPNSESSECSITSPAAENVYRDEHEVHIATMDFSEAKKIELDAWRHNKVYEEVNDEGQSAVTTRWVLTVKENGLKARLVARGFEDDELLPHERQSPTCTKELLRVIFSIAAIFNWKLYSLDIRAAFLQGDTVSRTIHLQPPKEAECVNKLWLLKKCVYRLRDASLKWYQKVRQVLLSKGCHVSAPDQAIFHLRIDGRLVGVVTVHVDDFIWTGEPHFEKCVINPLRAEIDVGKENALDFTYLGLKILSENEKGIVISLPHYSDGLSFIKNEEIGMNDFKKLVRSKIGQLTYLSNQIRPDLSFQVNILASTYENFEGNLMRSINKTIKSAKTEQVQLWFPALDINSLAVLVFSDASLGNMKNGCTQGGFIIFLGDGNNYVAPIMWTSKKLRRVAHSTLTAETLALIEAVDSAIFIRQALTEFIFGVAELSDIPIRCFVDNNDLNVALKSNKNVTEKRLRIDIHSLKNSIANDNIHVTWVPSKYQLADIFTKVGAATYPLLQVLREGRINCDSAEEKAKTG